MSDFDGTITRNDLVDGIVSQFSENDAWIAAEKEWAAGRIGSGECLRRQLSGVRIGIRALANYLESVRLDPGFGALKRSLDKAGVPLIVLSDGFDLLISETLTTRGFGAVPFRSNRLRWEDSRLLPSFPYEADSCGRCGHCKGSTLREFKPRVGHFIFIGDGLSDRCALEESGTVFAKGRLAEHCRAAGRAAHEFGDLSEVAREIPRLLSGLKDPYRARAARTA